MLHLFFKKEFNDNKRALALSKTIMLLKSPRQSPPMSSQKLRHVNNYQRWFMLVMFVHLSDIASNKQKRGKVNYR